MFLLRRRSDNKFWRNRSFHVARGYSASKAEDENWSIDPSTCKPSATASSLLHCRGVSGCYVETGERRYWDAVHYWVQRKFSKERFDALYEIVEVEIRVKEKRSCESN